jgi:NADH-quinone oxidoreductase subunit L
MAVQQNDIKRIIAYSTLSQLGYMVMAVGLSGPTPGDVPFDHARLFQGAAVLERRLRHHRHAPRAGHLAHGQLKKKMPVTFWTFTIGALALSGIPPFSGFIRRIQFSRNALEQKNYLLFAVAVFVAGLTAFYTFRLFFVVFFGKEKSDHAKHAHESPLVITAAAGDSGHVRDHRRFHRHHQQLRFAICRRPRNAFLAQQFSNRCKRPFRC